MSIHLFSPCAIPWRVLHVLSHSVGHVWSVASQGHSQKRWYPGFVLGELVTPTWLPTCVGASSLFTLSEVKLMHVSASLKTITHSISIDQWFSAFLMLNPLIQFRTLW